MTPPQPRRILMTTDAVGGVWVYAAELGRALCGAGERVTLVIMGPGSRRDQIQALIGVHRLSFENTDLALEWMDPEGADLSRAREVLLRIADRVAPDIVHLNSFREASFVWPAPVLVVAHSCVVSWWQACRQAAPTQTSWRTYAAAVADGLCAADAWAAPTRAFRDTIERIHAPRSRGQVIWNGANVPEADVPKQPLILAAGRVWDAAKNLHSLERVASALTWPVRVAGPTRFMDEACAGEQTANIDFLGELSRPQLLAEMQRAAIFVAPALYEPFGLTALEAAASGCALVLSDIPSFRELWNGAALFVEPRDHGQLTDALQIVSSDASLRRQLQSAASLRAQRYSLSGMVTAYRKLYDTLQAPGSAISSVHSKAHKELHA